MALIGSVVNQGSLQGEIASYNGALSGVFANTGLVGGQVVGMRGLQGEMGDTGATGNGIASVTFVSSFGLVDTYKITFTNGTETTFDVTNGEDGIDGIDGVDGHSPIVTASKVGKVTTVSVDGSAIATINDGNDGQDGADGFSPSASVSKVGDTATISITDKNGTTTASVSDGNGVPSGGSSGQVLAKASGTDYDLTWVNQSGGGGSITDVQVNGTTVVTNNVANVPVARSDRYGVIKGYYDTDPGGGVIGITIHNSSEQELTGYAPMSVYVPGSGYQPIMAKFLPDATQSVKGAMSASDKTKLDGIASGAEVNVQSNWTEADSSSDAYILNKPTIPTVNDATLTIKKNGTTVNTFTANASSNVTADISVPTVTSDLVNDSGFVTSADLPKEYDFTSSLTPSIDARGVSRAQYAIYPSDTSSLTSENGLKISAYLDYNGTIFYPLSVVFVEISSSLGKFNIYVKSFRDSVQSTSSSAYVSGTLHIVAPFQISRVSTYK